MRGLPSILSPFRNSFNKFNNTGARMVACHQKYLKHRIIKIIRSFTQRYNGRHNVTLKICKPLVVYRF